MNTEPAIPPCLETTDGHVYRCQRYGWTVRDPALPFRCSCRPDVTPESPPAESASPPGLLTQATHYAVALGKWSLYCFPVRNDKEVAAILDLCRACEHYDQAGTRCNICGCQATIDGAAWRNKIRMATEHCPRRPPRW